ncbi:ABC transporter permease [Sorangium sp. So ce375]|uniref:ABC transporter permease n=1 Tax=Sorangium sp. So ce375 TaxID=3133306 RepID=UPI003F5C35FA
MKVIPHGLLGRETTEAIAIPIGALAASLLVFGAFVAAQGANPLSVYYDMVRGAFGTWFSLQNTLLRAAPLMLTALCTALPARLGLIVIGGEGALVMGGLSAASAALACRAWGAPPAATLAAMLVSGLAAGALWIGLAGALRVYRGVSETISSLLLNYIGIAILNHLVEGALRDPTSLNKPSTASIGAENALGNLPGIDVHWGLAYGVLACSLCYVLMHRTTFGFGAAMSGGNVRAALLAGLPVKRLVVLTCTLAGACAGLAGTVEVAAVHGRANASLISGYGYTGILVAFIARHNPLAIVPVALLLGGIGASGGLLQRTARLPDATVSVLQGILFIAILASETLYGRSLAAREPKVRQAAPAPSVA